MHPPTDLTQNIFIVIANIFNSQHSKEVYTAALICFYHTVKSTKIHTNTLIQCKAITLLEAILNWEGADDKMKLLAMQTLREIASGGFHMALLEIPLINTIHRFISIVTPSNESLSQCLYQAALEII